MSIINQFTITEKIKTIARHNILKMTWRGRCFKRSIHCSHAWYGNTYGGFYLNPELMDEKTVVYSFGIGEDLSFDNEVIKNHNCDVFGFDPTPKSINWVKKQNLHGKFHFHEIGISNKSGIVDFYLPVNHEYVSGSVITQKNVDTRNKVPVCVKTIRDIMKELGHTHIDVLKMDIEGSEYDVIDDILNSGVPVTQMLIEFHDRFLADGKLRTISSIKKLETNGYKIFAVSDSFEEISFINKNAVQIRL